MPQRSHTPSRIRLPLLGDVSWSAFYTGTLIAPPLFVVAVWLFFSRVDWPHAWSDRALFVSGVSVILSFAFSTFLLNAVGRAYVRLRAALRTVRRQNLQLRALHQAGVILNEDLDLSTVLSRIIGLSRHVLDVAAAHLDLVDEDGPPLEQETVEPSEDATVLRVPVRFHGELLAVLRLSRPSLPFGLEEQKTAERFATRAGAAIANARLLAEVRDLGGAAERERIARELHDGTVQSLFGLSLQMQSTLLDPARTPADVEAAMHESVERIGEILRGIQAYVSDSAHAEQDRCDLESALRAEVDGTAAPDDARLVWRWRPEGSLRVPVGAARELGRVVRESVAAVLARAADARATVTVEVHAGSLVVEVRGEGRGLLADSGPGDATYGDMVRRMRRLGGDLTVESHPVRGTRVVARLPWAA